MGLSALRLRPKAPSSSSSFAFFSHYHGSQSRTPKGGSLSMYWSTFELLLKRSPPWNSQFIQFYDPNHRSVTAICFLYTLHTTKRILVIIFCYLSWIRWSVSLPLIESLSWNDCITWTSVKDFKASLFSKAEKQIVVKAQPKASFSRKTFTLIWFSTKQFALRKILNNVFAFA